MNDTDIHIPQCGNPRAHEPHAYERQFTTRHCDGLAKQEHFCGDRTAHKRHENATHYCPGINRQHILKEAHEVRIRLRQYGLMVPLNTVRRDYTYWLRTAEIFEGLAPNDWIARGGTASS